jgi:hypothetical protein
MKKLIKISCTKSGFENKNEKLDLKNFEFEKKIGENLICNKLWNLS